MSELSTPRVAHAESLVPSGYAEKAMASLLQLHTELMEEKERRVDLYRRLMEKEQAIAELRMYVKLLEEKAQQSTPAPKAEPVLRAVTPVGAASAELAGAVSPVATANVDRKLSEASATTSPRPTQISPPMQTSSRPLPKIQSAQIPGAAFPTTTPRKIEDWKTW